MAKARAVLVDGPPGTGRTRLVQELTLQCGAAGLPLEAWPAQRRGHPLMRHFDPTLYPDLEAYASVLEVQWHNFAIRAATQPRWYLFDGALLQTGFRTLLAAGAGQSAIAAIAARLLAALDSLEPALVYLSRREAPGAADPGWERWRDCCDSVFAGLSQHRLLLNASRADASELLQDALDYLDLRHRSLSVDPALTQGLEGRYVSAEGELRIHAGDALPRVSLPGRSTPVNLLPTGDAHFLAAGVDLRIEPLRRGGRIEGLLLHNEDPEFATLPGWLPRGED